MTFDELLAKYQADEAALAAASKTAIAAAAVAKDAQSAYAQLESETRDRRWAFQALKEAGWTGPADKAVL
jgi:hypothetical protein